MTNNELGTLIFSNMILMTIELELKGLEVAGEMGSSSQKGFCSALLA